jgi:hypothetical protein
MRFLFLILFHREIGFVADIRYYASDVWADAFVGTIQNPSRPADMFLVVILIKFLFPYQL